MPDPKSDLADEEVRSYLVRALTLVNAMAGEGLSIDDQEDPADLMTELAERLGVEDEDDSWAAVVAALDGSDHD